MEKTQRIEITVNVAACESHDSETMRRTNGAETLDLLARTLRAYGIDVDVLQSGRSATIKLDTLTPPNAERARTRNAGRTKKYAYRYTLEELEAMGADEGCKRLGCSKRTYYRRLAEMRAKTH